MGTEVNIIIHEPPKRPSSLVGQEAKAPVKFAKIVGVASTGEESSDDVVVLNMLVISAEGNQSLVRVTTDTATLVRIANQTRTEDQSFARTLSRTRGTKHEAAAARLFTRYAGARAAVQKVAQEKLPEVKDIAQAEVIVRGFVEGSQELSAAASKLDTSTLTEKEKIEFQEATTQLIESSSRLVMIALQQGLNVSDLDNNTAHVQDESSNEINNASSGFVGKAVAYAYEVLDNIMEIFRRANDSDKTDDKFSEKKLAEKKAEQNRIARRAEELKHDIKMVLLQIMSTGGADEGLIRQAKALLAEAKDFMASSALPTSIAVDMTSQLHLLEKEIEKREDSIEFIV